MDKTTSSGIIQQIEAKGVRQVEQKRVLLIQGTSEKKWLFD
ncbi:hypothetical protein ACSFCM_08085 [Enterococcus gilvus]